MHSGAKNNLLFALLMIDDTDNHLYFSHKYKISNLLKEYLAFIHSHFIQVKKNKNFFGKDLKKNIFYHGKRRMTSLAKFYFISKNKKNYLDLKNILNNISSVSIPKFPITGTYLLEKGFKSGRKIGEVLKEAEKLWIKNNFDLKDEELSNLLKKYN